MSSNGEVTSVLGSAFKMSDTELVRHYEWMLKVGRIQENGSAFIRMKYLQKRIAKRKYNNLLKRVNMNSNTRLLSNKTNKKEKQL